MMYTSPLNINTSSTSTSPESSIKKTLQKLVLKRQSLESSSKNSPLPSPPPSLPPKAKASRGDPTADITRLLHELDQTRDEDASLSSAFLPETPRTASKNTLVQTQSFGDEILLLRSDLKHAKDELSVRVMKNITDSYSDYDSDSGSDHDNNSDNDSDKESISDSEPKRSRSRVEIGIGLSDDDIEANDISGVSREDSIFLNDQNSSTYKSMSLKTRSKPKGTPSKNETIASNLSDEILTLRQSLKKGDLQKANDAIKLQKINSEHGQAVNEITRLRIKLQSKNSDISELKIDLLKLANSDNNNNNRAPRNDNEKNSKNLELEIRKLRTQIIHLVKTSVDSTKVADDFENKHTSRILSARINDLQDENSKLRNQIAASKSNDLDNDVLQSKVEALEVRIVRLTAHNETLTAKIVKKRNTDKESEDKITSLEVHIANLTFQNEALTLKVAKKKSVLQRQKVILRELVSERDRLTEEVECVLDLNDTTVGDGGDGGGYDLEEGGEDGEEMGNDEGEFIFPTSRKKNVTIGVVEEDEKEITTEEENRVLKIAIKRLLAVDNANWNARNSRSRDKLKRTAPPKSLRNNRDENERARSIERLQKPTKSSKLKKSRTTKKKKSHIPDDEFVGTFCPPGISKLKWFGVGRGGSRSRERERDLEREGVRRKVLAETGKRGMSEREKDFLWRAMSGGSGVGGIEKARDDEDDSDDEGYLVDEDEN